MASISTFKNPGMASNRTRVMTTEDKFSRGMNYVNTTQSPGYVKNLVNYVLKNDGNVLTWIHILLKNVHKMK